MFTAAARPSFVSSVTLPATSRPALLTSLRPPRVLQRRARPAPRLLPAVMTPSATATPAAQEAIAEKGQAKVATDVLVFIHGITIDAEPGSATEDRLEGYKNLYDLVQESAQGTPNGEEWAKAVQVGVQWGFKSVDQFENPLVGDHTLLGEAERFSVKRTDAIEEEHLGFTINPLKILTRNIRTPLRYGLSDMFFYVSRGGRPLVRRAVARQIMNSSVKELVQSGEPIQLTLFGHSAGSVVAHDFAFFLQNAKDKSPTEIMAAINSFAEFQDAKGNPAEPSMEDIRSMPPDDKSLAEDLIALVEHARQGKLKIRKLVTFGSPLHIMFIRSRPVLKLFASGKGVDPAIYGLKEPCEGASNPRWINVVEADDIIAGPVTGLIDDEANTVGDGQVVEDVYLELTRSIREAHQSYWTAGDFAQTIAEKW